MDEEEVVAGDDITQADQYYTEESYIEQPYATEGYSAEQTYQGESYEGQVYQDQVYGGDQTEVIQQQGNLGLDLQLSDGDEGECRTLCSSKMYAQLLKLLSGFNSSAYFNCMCYLIMYSQVIL